MLYCFAGLLYKIVTDEYGFYLFNEWGFRHDIDTADIRSHNLLTIYEHKSTKFEFSFSYCAPIF